MARNTQTIASFFAVAEQAKMQWPPEPRGTLLTPESPDIQSLFDKGRELWDGEDWKLYAEFLEGRGKGLQSLCKKLYSENQTLKKKLRRRKIIKSRGTLLTPESKKKPGRPKRSGSKLGTDLERGLELLQIKEDKQFLTDKETVLFFQNENSRFKVTRVNRTLVNDMSKARNYLKNSR